MPIFRQPLDERSYKTSCCSFGRRPSKIHFHSVQLFLQCMRGIFANGLLKHKGHFLFLWRRKMKGLAADCTRSVRRRLKFTRGVEVFFSFSARERGEWVFLLPPLLLSSDGEDGDDDNPRILMPPSPFLLGKIQRERTAARRRREMVVRGK